MLLGNGNGTFQAAQNIAVTGNPSEVAVADLNLDGVPDIAVSRRTNNSMTLMIGNGDGTFASQEIALGAGSTGVTVGDWNGDLKPDLALANYYADNVTVLLHD